MNKMKWFLLQISYNYFQYMYEEKYIEFFFLENWNVSLPAACHNVTSIVRHWNSVYPSVKWGY